VKALKIYDAVVIGDVNIDLVVVGCNELPLPGQEIYVENMLVNVGGGAALFTLSLAKLGLKLAFNGVLGNDSYGTFILEQFHQYGIDTTSIKISKSSNTGISIAINPEKDRSFITYAGSNTELNLQQLDLEAVTLGRHVHLTGYKGSQNHHEFLKLVQSLKNAGLTLSCDIGWDDTGEWSKGIFEIMKYIDVFFMNEMEAQHYSRCTANNESIRFLARYSDHIVVKLGAEGAMAIKNENLTYQSGYSVNCIDTTGAGDSFNAGYIYGYLTHKEVKDCLIYGNACGAMSVSSYGGSTGTPDMETLEQFINDNAVIISKLG
jgi:sugar/nucleoside kinase (ribokinase family)